MTKKTKKAMKQIRFAKKMVAASAALAIMSTTVVSPISTLAASQPETTTNKAENKQTKNTIQSTENLIANPNMIIARNPSTAAITMNNWNLNFGGQVNILGNATAQPDGTYYNLRIPGSLEQGRIFIRGEGAWFDVRPSYYQIGSIRPPLTVKQNVNTELGKTYTESIEFYNTANNGRFYWATLAGTLHTNPATGVYTNDFVADSRTHEFLVTFNSDSMDPVLTKLSVRNPKVFLKYGAEWALVDGMFTDASKTTIRPSLTNEELDQIREAVGAIDDKAVDKATMTDLIGKADEQLTPKAPIIDRITSQDTIITGTARANAEVEVNTRYTASGPSVFRQYMTTADGDGKYSIVIPTQPVGSQVSAIQTAGGKTSPLSVTTVMDGERYPAPIINPVTSTDTTVTGRGTAGAKVEITIGDDTYTADVNAAGNFVVNIGTARPTGTEMSVVLKGDFEKTSDPITAEVGKSLLEQATEAVDALFSDGTHTGLAGGVKQADIDAAKALVERLPAGTAKQELLDEIAKAQNLLDAQAEADKLKAAQDAVDDLFADGTHTGLAPGVGQADIDAAKELVDALKPGTAKDELLDEITKAQNLLDAQAEADKLKAAQDAVDDLFSDDSHTGLAPGVGQAEVDAAKELVEALKPGTDKDELLDEIAKAQDLIDAQEAADKLKAAQDAVDALFSDGTHTALAPGVDQAAIDAAKALVDALPAGTDKTELLAEVAKAQALSDATPANGSVTPASFRLGTDRAVTGTYTGNVAEVSLVVNGVDKGKAVVRGGVVSYYAMDKIRNITDVVELVSYDNRGVQNDRKRVTILSTAPTTGTVTPNEFDMATDRYVTGTFTGAVTRVGLKVNGTELGKVGVSAGQFSYYAFRAFTATDTVQVVGYDATGKVLDTKTVNIKTAAPTTGTVTPGTFNVITDRKVEGTVTGDVYRVALEVNGTERGKVGIVGGAFSYYAFNIIRSTSDVAEVVAYDKDGKVLDRKAVTITDGVVAPIGTVTANPFTVGTTNTLTGTATGDVVKVGLRVDDVDKSKVSVIGGNYSYYARGVITSATQKVEIIGYNAAGAEITKTDVTVN